MKKLFSLLCSFALISLPLVTFARPFPPDSDNDRLDNCADVMQEILDVPDNIPQNLLNKAECVAVFPSVIKGAVIVGGTYGRGAMLCRSGEHFHGPWGAPAMMRLEGGSFGAQIGGQATDLVLLIMNDRGAKAILHSKVKLGGDASAAAGPVGREAEADTDVTMRAEILSYSRARGLFAGIALEGSTIRPDNDADQIVYGKAISAEDIVLRGQVSVTPAGQRLVSLLEKHSPKNDSAK
ncbi:MAG TPA: lipid-binding SYLF domain-containing protein [Methylomirabilota bacterium]|jgi:lipid-binding SYLF domain-containing protein|nr:lipid-binding SYLF domain-containing protein [Methylomirabilota bacterium]